MKKCRDGINHATILSVNTCETERAKMGLRSEAVATVQISKQGSAERRMSLEGVLQWEEMATLVPLLYHCLPQLLDRVILKIR